MNCCGACEAWAKGDISFRTFSARPGFEQMWRMSHGASLLVGSIVLVAC